MIKIYIQNLTINAIKPCVIIFSTLLIRINFLLYLTINPDGSLKKKYPTSSAVNCSPGRLYDSVIESEKV